MSTTTPIDLTTHLRLTPHDIAQLLLHLQSPDIPYRPSEHLLLLPGPNQDPIEINELLLETKEFFNLTQSYRLLIAPLKSKSPFSKGFSATSSTLPTAPHFLVPKNHPLLLVAPPIPPHLYINSPQFSHKTTAELTILQSQKLLHTLLQPFGIPLSAFETWTSPLNLNLERLWPHPTQPFACNFTISLPGADPLLPSSIDFTLPSLSEPLPFNYSAIHQNILLGLLLPLLQLSPDSPWKLANLTITPNSPEYRTYCETHNPALPFGAPITPSNAAFYNYSTSNLALITYNPHTAASLHTPIPLSSLLVTPPSPPLLNTWLQIEHERLQHLQHTALMQQCSC